MREQNGGESVQGSLPSIQFPAQLFIYAIPCAIYALVRRLRGATWAQISSGLGLQRSRPVYYVWALVFFVAVGVLSLVTIYVFFPGYYDRPGGAAAQYAGVDLGILTLLYAFVRESIYVALGEELFFRGLVGGWLMRHLGFWVGNSLQSLVFLAPHLLVLSAGLELYGRCCWRRSFPAGSTGGCCTARGVSCRDGWHTG
ncbi:MAG: CPBP family intramembrane metalloprotease [Rubrobacter sp.]|nr:CPBP family intramembrane metalloprotease [Rubrobacter sp.]